MAKYIKNKNWNMFVEEDKLFITKGADEIYFLDDIEGEYVKKLIEAYSNELFDDIDKDVLKKLEMAGVIYQTKFDFSKPKIKVCFKYYGTSFFKFHKILTDFISKKDDIEIVKSPDKCDLLLIVRINDKLKGVLEGYDKIKVPHLFIDLGYSNTISIGPLVFKGETACLGCFIGRITKNWGDLMPPEEPEVLNKAELISFFIIERIKEYKFYGNCPDLINGAWNYNFNSNTTKLDGVYRLPWCPICNGEKENPKMGLPWYKEVNYDE